MKERLQTLEDTIRERTGFLSLAPERTHATSFVQLLERLREQSSDRETLQLEQVFASIVDASFRAFPDNLFWDFDLVTTWLIEHQGNPLWLNAFGERWVSIAQLFGCSSSIRFQYLHDFLYGYDWAKWVRKAPQERLHIQPFDLVFLEYSEARARELTHAIAQSSDEKYPPIEATHFRNPFAFARTPDEEIRLLRELVQRDAIPLRAWLEHDRLDPMRLDFSQMRTRVADATSRND